MLWCMDAGRPLLFFPEPRRLPEANVWAMREPTGLFHRHSSAPFQLTTGPLSFESLVPSADGKKLFVSALQGRGELVRYDPDPSNSCRFLRGYRRANWTSRGTASGSHMFPILIAHFGAAGGRQRSIATNLSAGFGRPAPLVSRRYPDRLCWLASPAGLCRRF